MTPSFVRPTIGQPLTHDRVWSAANDRHISATIHWAPPLQRREEGDRDERDWLSPSEGTEGGIRRPVPARGMWGRRLEPEEEVSAPACEVTDLFGQIASVSHLVKVNPGFDLAYPLVIGPWRGASGRMRGSREFGSAASGRITVVSTRMAAAGNGLSGKVMSWSRASLTDAIASVIEPTDSRI